MITARAHNLIHCTCSQSCAGRRNRSLSALSALSLAIPAKWNCSCRPDVRPVRVCVRSSWAELGWVRHTISPGDKEKWGRALCNWVAVGRHRHRTDGFAMTQQCSIGGGGCNGQRFWRSDFAQFTTRVNADQFSEERGIRICAEMLANPM